MAGRGGAGMGGFDLSSAGLVGLSGRGGAKQSEGGDRAGTKGAGRGGAPVFSLLQCLSTF